MHLFIFSSLFLWNSNCRSSYCCSHSVTPSVFLFWTSFLLLVCFSFELGSCSSELKKDSSIWDISQPEKLPMVNLGLDPDFISYMYNHWTPQTRHMIHFNFCYCGQLLLCILSSVTCIYFHTFWLFLNITHFQLLSYFVQKCFMRPCFGKFLF